MSVAPALSNAALESKLCAFPLPVREHSFLNLSHIDELLASAIRNIASIPPHPRPHGPGRRGCPGVDNALAGARGLASQG